MAERKNNRSNAGANAEDSENMDMDMDLNEMDEVGGTGGGGQRRRANTNTMDPMDRVAQLYQFMRSPQVDMTIKRFVTSRKARQLISAGLSVLEVIVVMLPLLRKLGGRVGDLSSLLKRPERSNTTTTAAQGPRRRTAQLPASSVN